MNGLLSIIEYLRALGLNPDVDDLADAIWFAAQVGVPLDGGTAISADEASPVPEPFPWRPQATPSRPVIHPEPQTPHDGMPEQRMPTAQLPAEGLTQDTASGGAVPIRVGAQTVLGDTAALFRALRPLRRRFRSRRATVLDEIATIQRRAETRTWLPVMRPAWERWFDVALLVDTGASMTFWQEIAVALYHLLVRSNAFRDVRIWSMHSRAGEVSLSAGLSWVPPQKLGRSPRELRDPSGRRLVLVVSDCTASGWHTGEVTRQVLAPLAAAHLTTIVQVLPRTLWRHTVLGAARAAILRVATSASANDHLHVEMARDRRRGPERYTLRQGELAVPVLELEPRAMHRWALLATGASGAWAPGYLLGDELTREQLSDSASTEDPAAAVRRFDSNASPRARRLAGLLASIAPLTPPLMRLVHITSELHPNAQHLAEIMLSGLLRRVTPLSASIDPADIQYDFRPGVAEILISGVSRTEVSDVRARLCEHLQQTTDPISFRALLADPNLLGPLRMRMDGRSFAQLNLSVLQKLGGDLARLAERLAQAGPGALPEALVGDDEATSEPEQSSVGYTSPRADGTSVEEVPAAFSSAAVANSHKALEGFREGVALIIGVNQGNPVWGTPAITNDARTLYSVLTDPEIGGYDVRQTELLLDQAATRDEVLAAIERLAARCTDESVVLISISCMGAPGEGDSFWLATSDAHLLGWPSPRIGAGTGLSSADLAQALKDLPARRLVLIVNTNAAERVSDTLKAAGLGAQFQTDAQGERGQTRGPEGWAVIASCGRSELSYTLPDQEYSLFGQALIDAVRGIGSSGFLPHNTGVTLFQSLAGRVRRVSLRYLGLSQEPSLTEIWGAAAFAVAKNPSSLASEAGATVEMFAEGHALIVGIGEYGDLRWNNTTAEQDARLLYMTLIDPLESAYPRRHVELLVNENATRLETLKALQRLADRCEPDSTVLIVFNCHGAPGEDGLYYLATSGTIFTASPIGSVVSGTGFHVGDLARAIRAIPARRLVLILNADGAGNAARSLASGGIISYEDERTEDQASSGESRVIISACGPEQLSLIVPEEQGSIFGQALVSTLRGSEVETTGDTINLFEFYSAVFAQVNRFTALRGLAQEPEISVAQGRGSFPVARYPQRPAQPSRLDASENALQSAAVTTESRVQGRALIVGVSEYHDERWNAPTAARDAQGLYEALVNSGGSYGSEHVELLLDEQCTRSGVLAAIRRLADRCSRESVAIISFTGQGATSENGLYYLATSDARFTAPPDVRILDSFGIHMGELSRAIREIPARHLLLVVNAGNAIADAPSELTPGQAFPADGNAIATSGDNWAIITASREGQQSLFETGAAHSYFGGALIDVLRRSHGESLGLYELYEAVYNQVRDVSMRRVGGVPQEAELKLPQSSGPFLISGKRGVLGPPPSAVRLEAIAARFGLSGSFTRGRALVIGVSNYHNPRWNIPIAVRDARGLAETLVDPRLSGYAPAVVEQLLDEDATRAAVFAALTRLADRCDEQSVALVSINSRSTFDEDGVFCIATMETRFTGPPVERIVQGTGLSMTELARALRAIPARQLLLVLNINFADDVGTSDAPHEAVVELLATGEGRVIITGRREGQPSYIQPEELYSYFGRALIDGFRGAAGSAINGFVGLYELYESVYRQVMDVTLRRFGVVQEPVLTFVDDMRPFPVGTYPGAAWGDGRISRQPISGAAIRSVSQDVVAAVDLGRAESLHAPEPPKPERPPLLSFSGATILGSLTIGTVSSHDTLMFQEEDFPNVLMDPLEALPRLRERIAVARNVDEDERDEATTRLNLAHRALSNGDVAKARLRLAQALAILELMNSGYIRSIVRDIQDVSRLI